MTIIAFISQKGGVGKSTLAQALATEASKKKIKILLADCDPQQSTSQRWTKLRKENNLSAINSQVFNSVKEIWSLTDKYDLIVIDAPARTSQGTLEIAKHANLIIQPTSATRVDLEPAIREFNSLEKNGIPAKRLVFILNNLITPAEEKAVREYLSATNYHCLPYSLFARVSYRQAQNEGKAITEVSYKSLQKQVKKLLNSILDYIG
jgi:chromosome partitioning protein